MQNQTLRVTEVIRGFLEFVLPICDLPQEHLDDWVIRECLFNPKESFFCDLILVGVEFIDGQVFHGRQEFWAYLQTFLKVPRRFLRIPLPLICKTGEIQRFHVARIRSQEGDQDGQTIVPLVISYQSFGARVFCLKARRRIALRT